MQIYLYSNTASTFFLQMGQAAVEIIIPNPVVFYSSPLLPLNIQRKINTMDITVPMSVIILSLNAQGLY